MLSQGAAAKISPTIKISLPETCSAEAVFGLLVGLVGCAQGLQTGRTADAVGRAATAAVVGSLVLITIFDGLFAVLFHVLGI